MAATESQELINQSHDPPKVQKVPVLWTGRLDFCIAIRSTVQTPTWEPTALKQWLIVAENQRGAYTHRLWPCLLHTLNRCLDLPLTWANFSDYIPKWWTKIQKIPHSPQPTMGHGNPIENTRALINNIVSLTKSLPTSVPLATDEDRIFAVMNSPEGKSTWHRMLWRTVWGGLLWFHRSIMALRGSFQAQLSLCKWCGHVFTVFQ